MKTINWIVWIIAIIAVLANMAMDVEIRNLKIENYELKRETQEFEQNCYEVEG